MTATTRRVRLDLAFDGTDFAGWQVQPGRRTVQETIEQVLALIQGFGSVRLRAAGRTDSGVHARHQVADGHIASRLGDRALLRALATLLPRDVRAFGVRTVDEAFHSRKDAVSKTYRYTIDRSECGDPFLSRFALHHPHAVDREALEDALARLVGRRDFAGFAGAASRVLTTVRNMSEARYEERGADLADFVFTADGFLNHMVRNLVGTALEVARGRLAPSRIDEVLVSRDRALAGPTAPAHGLTLERVVYAGEHESRDAESVRRNEKLL